MSPRSLPFLIVPASTLVALAPAAAVESRHGEGPLVAVHNGTVRIDGDDAALGPRRRIRTGEGSDSAACVMEQNATPWRRSQDGCPEA